MLCSKFAPSPVLVRGAHWESVLTQALMYAPCHVLVRMLLTYAPDWCLYEPRLKWPKLELALSLFLLNPPPCLILPLLE